ncbi:type III polyketide synthase [Desertivirga xinjiangensis]|uniref:type III polyketide synthase n=1 Tax=Desertivirga xinjiangensis TaxID=539206 RepID=UPI002108A7E7|nr:type III polyketide synthase [Pedobacter xinjiangensis]
MASIISAIGTANPVNRFAQNILFDFMADAHQLDAKDMPRLRKLYDVSGIEYRHSVIADFGVPRGTYSFFGNYEKLEPFPGTKQRSALYEQSAKYIAVEAVGNLLKSSDIEAGEFTHLITVSCTGMYAPGLDIDLIEALKLNKSMERTCINFMGCYGAFNALKIADYICRADHSAKVLIVDVELCTLHFQRENTMENWVANSLFADGAAAVAVVHESDSQLRSGFLLKTFHNSLLTEGRDEMAWRIGDTGFEMNLSARVPKNISKNICAVADSLSQKAGINRSAVNHTAIHPGGRRILEVCEEMLELPEEALDHSYDVLKNFGNMSSVTILFILKRLMEQSAPAEKVMSFAFGPGLTVESMLLEVV